MTTTTIPLPALPPAPPRAPRTHTCPSEYPRVTPAMALALADVLNAVVGHRSGKPPQAVLDLLADAIDLPERPRLRWRGVVWLGPFKLCYRPSLARPWVAHQGGHDLHTLFEVAR